MIRALLLGPVSLTVDGDPPPPALLWQKNLALLVYLARSPRQARSREHLLALLWPDRPEDRARHSLNEALRIIRQSLGDGLETDNVQIRLREGSVATDLDEFESHVAAGHWEEASKLVAGDFLQNLALKDASGFEDWLAAERRDWRGRAIDALVRHAAALLNLGRLAEAGNAARFALSLDPVAEAAFRLEVRILALTGERNAALRRAEEFSRRLRDLVGAEPAAETLALIERVRRERVSEPRLSTPTAHAESTRRLPLSGRGPELRRLLAAWEECRVTRRSSAVLIEGEVGVGKTRLIEELTGRARLDGAVVSLVRSVEGDRAEDGATLWGLACGDLRDAPGVNGASPAALATFATRLVDWQERFRATGGQAPLPLSAAFEEVVRAATEESPVMLVVDDAQWGDRASLLALEGILRALARSPVQVLFAISASGLREELDQLKARIPRDQSGMVITLHPLDAGSIRALCADVVPHYGANELDRLARRIATDSAGLPLLVVELLHAVAGGMELQQGAGAWPEPLHTLTQTLPGDLPDAVVGAIRVGFRRLSAGAQELLIAISVLGDRVAVGDLRKVTDQGPAAAAAALDELEWQRWVTAEPRGYGFVAGIAREVIARDMVTRGQRERLLERHRAP